MKTRRKKEISDPWRKRLLDAIESAGDTLQGVSAKLERNDAYLHQYIYRASPRVLGERERRLLAARYRIPQENLMPPGWVNELLTNSSTMEDAPREDAERSGEKMSPTRKAIQRIMRLPLPYDERIAIVNDLLESPPETNEPAPPTEGQRTL